MSNKSLIQDKRSFDNKGVDLLMEKDSTLTEKTFKGLFWMFSGKGSQAIMQFIVTIVLARLLMPSDFGIVSAAMVVITFTTAFSMVGVGPALIQRPNLNQSHIRTGFTITIILSIIFAILLYISSPLIANFFNMEKLTTVLQVMSVIFLLKGISIVSESLLQRKLNFRLFASIEVFSYILYGIIGIGTAVVGFGYWALVYAKVSQDIVKSILLITLAKHNMKPQFHLQSAKELIFFGGGFTIARLSNQFALQADKLVAGRWLGSGALGLYERAYQLMVMPTNLFGQVMDKVLFPAMAQIQKKQNQLSRSFRVGITTVAFFTIPVGILMCLLSVDIVRLLFGEKWLDLVPAFQVLSIGLVFRTGYKISDSLARATGAVYRRAWRQIVYALAVFCGAWIGQHWGIMGLSFGVLAAIFLNYCLMTNLSMRFVNLSIKDIILAHFPGILLGVVSLVSYFLVNQLSTIIYLPSFIRIFLTGILFLLFMGILVKINAERFLGKDVVWIRDQVMKMVKGRRKKSV